MARSKKAKNKQEIDDLVVDNTNESYKRDTSPKIHQRSKLKDPINIRQRDDLTEKQKALIQLIKDKHTNIVFVDGVSGTSKTFCAVLAGLELLNEKKICEILFLRSIAESASLKLGSVPGGVSDKFSAFTLPLMDKLDEMLDAGTIKFLMADGRIKAEPINFQRGASHNVKYIILEESQSLNEFEIKTIMTRIGRFTKLIIIGDHQQADIRNSGFQKVFNLFDDEFSRNEGIFCLKFTKEDILRSGIVRFIVDKFETIQGE